MKIYLTRHGLTDWNQRHIIQGKTDIPLNEEGRAQARITRDTLAQTPLEAIYVSPLIRARETAQIINELHHVPIYPDQRLEERGFGDLEGADIDQVDFTHFWNIAYEHSYRCERTSLFYERVYDFIEEIKQAKHQTILVVAHGGVSLPFYFYFHARVEDGDMRQYMLHNCEVACYHT